MQTAFENRVSETIANALRAEGLIALPTPAGLKVICCSLEQPIFVSVEGPPA